MGGPCTGINVATFTAGTSTRLRVDGVFVVLDSLIAKTDKASAVHVDQTSINNNLLEAELMSPVPAGGTIHHGRH